MYKLLAKIITSGFQKRFVLLDNLQTIPFLIEKATEYNIPLYLDFVEDHKVFDSIETFVIIGSLQNRRIRQQKGIATYQNGLEN